MTNTCVPMVTILSDSRSLLDLLRNPRSSHPLGNAIQRNIQRIRAQGRKVKLIRLRAHIGTAENERADEPSQLCQNITGLRQDKNSIGIRPEMAG